MKKAIQMYTVRDFTGSREEVRETLKKVKAMGYEGVQTWTPDFMEHREYKALLDEIGLITLSANGDYDAMLRDPGAIEAAVDQSNIYGVDTITIGTLPEPLRESAHGFREFAAGCNKIGEVLLPRGMKLLYHPHALEFFSLGKGLKGMDIILSETKYLEFCLDTHWLTAGGVNICDWIRKVEGRAKYIHFKDYSIVGGAQTVETVCKTFAPVGEGNINWSQVVEACKEIGIEWAIVEQDICRQSPFDCLQTSYENMVKFSV